MPEALKITLAPERLDIAAPEERVCFGRFTIGTPSGSLTSGIDHYIEGYRDGPLVSGYHAAEWFAWNWWRLRYEPRSPAVDWWRAHKMTAIGEGYMWPNLTIFSDGVRTTLLSEPSIRPDAKPFRYLGANPAIVPSSTFESAVDEFIGVMEGRLFKDGLKDTPVSRIWADVKAERADPAQAQRRRLEALLARDPDDDQDDAVDRLIGDIAALGEQPVEELAAEAGRGGPILQMSELIRLARQDGTRGRSSDGVKLLSDTTPLRWGEAPAWEIGAGAAQLLRQEHGLGAEPIEDDQLAQMNGIRGEGIHTKPSSPLAFALDSGKGEVDVVFRSSGKAGRRFELARLLADRLVPPASGRLHAATRAYTYRQKMQRSFAAELLSPFLAVDAILNGDYSVDKQEDAAEYFGVSPRTILTLLVNHHRLAREELGEALDLAA